MGFLDIFKKNKPEEQSESLEIEPTEEQFIDNSEPDINNTEVSIKQGLHAIFDYASIDFEQRGYQDALINPDSSYKSENINLLIEDLNIKVRIAKNYYTSLLKKIDFHIVSRKDAGLVDTVNELESKKSMIEHNFNEVIKIEIETEEDKGLVLRLKLSYSRGFNRGLASLSKDILQSNI